MNIDFCGVGNPGLEASNTPSSNHTSPHNVFRATKVVVKTDEIDIPGKNGDEVNELGDVVTVLNGEFLSIALLESVMAFLHVIKNDSLHFCSLSENHLKVFPESSQGFKTDNPKLPRRS